MPTTIIYGVGLCYMSVCTDDTDEEATRILNSEHPTGMDSYWKISENKTFKSGKPNPCPCEQEDGRRHILFDC